MSSKESIEAQLTEWHGCLAEVWDYTASLGTLRIRLSHADDPTCVILRLHGCRRVTFLPAWGDFRPELEPIEDGAMRYWRFSDGMNLAVECSKVQLSQNFDNWTCIPASPLN
jgi:hypothetical protein